jgi:hypothetical protein
MSGERSDCTRHICWRTAPGGYCIAPRCYCGSCPWYVPIDAQQTNTPDAITALDSAAVKAHGYRADGRGRARGAR